MSLRRRTPRAVHNPIVAPFDAAVAFVHSNAVATTPPVARLGCGNGEDVLDTDPVPSVIVLLLLVHASPTSSSHTHRPQGRPDFEPADMHEVQLRVLCSSALRIVDPFHVGTAHHVFAARGNTTAAGTITPAAAAAAAVQTPGRAEVKKPGYRGSGLL